jgi:hypothetical protein
MNNNSDTFNIGDMIKHKGSDDGDDRYHYIVLDTFSRYTFEYYNLFCLQLSREVTLRKDNAHHYQIVSKA